MKNNFIYAKAKYAGINYESGLKNHQSIIEIVSKNRIDEKNKKTLEKMDFFFDYVLTNLENRQIKYFELSN